MQQQREITQYCSLKETRHKGIHIVYDSMYIKFKSRQNLGIRPQDSGNFCGGGRIETGKWYYGDF